MHVPADLILCPEGPTFDMTDGCGRYGYPGAVFPSTAGDPHLHPKPARRPAGCYSIRTGVGRPLIDPFSLVDNREAIG